MPVASGSARAARPSYHRPHGQDEKKVFTDSELSEIFQIDFGEIFGSPDITAPDSSYRGINLPSKNQRGSQMWSVDLNPLINNLFEFAGVFHTNIEALKMLNRTLFSIRHGFVSEDPSTIREEEESGVSGLFILYIIFVFIFKRSPSTSFPIRKWRSQIIKECVEWSNQGPSFAVVVGSGPIWQTSTCKTSGAPSTKS